MLYCISSFCAAESGAEESTGASWGFLSLAVIGGNVDARCFRRAVAGLQVVRAEAC
jgi:hypothetical protein